ncbi:MAG TPA: hypothetical protein VH643_22015 [Gemmataceae bacterium]|jgi:hypothetical protein
MSFLFTGVTNDTCDIYRAGSSPPSPPAVGGVRVFVIPRFRNIKANFNGLFTYTHILCMPLGTDVRDNYGGGAAADVLYLPNGPNWGVQLLVSFVCRRRGDSLDYLEVYANALEPPPNSLLQEG